MRVLLLAPAVLMCSALHAADSYELHYFTQNHDVCPPCKVTSEIVDRLSSEGRLIAVHNYQKNLAPFEFYEVENTPSFLLLKNGKRYRYYEQSPGYNFSYEFIKGIAPPASVALDQQRSDCANPIGKILRNILPPPPAPGVVRDVPDVQKVERIQKLEALVASLKVDQRSLQTQFNALHKQHHEVLDALKRLDAILKQQKPPTHTTEQITKVDDRPITIRMQGIREERDGTKTVTSSTDQAYPRGTPVVLQFNEKFLD